MKSRLLSEQQLTSSAAVDMRKWENIRVNVQHWQWPWKFSEPYPSLRDIQVTMTNSKLSRKKICNRYKGRQPAYLHTSMHHKQRSKLQESKHTKAALSGSQGCAKFNVQKLQPHSEEPDSSELETAQRVQSFTCHAVLAFLLLGLSHFAAAASRTQIIMCTCSCLMASAHACQATLHYQKMHSHSDRLAYILLDLHCSESG
jgi:hypothetical protein